MGNICKAVNSRAGNIRYGVLVLAFVFLAAAAETGRAAGPAMMPGFPLRAGANVMLMWMPFPGAASYNIYRGEKAGGPYQKLASAPANNFMDPNVPADKTFYYVVKAVVGGKEGDASTEVTIKGIEPMKAPAIGGHLVTTDYKIALRWDADPRAAFYNLFRSESEKGEYALLSSVQDLKFTDSGVTVGKTYFYKLTAVSQANVESAKSAAYAVKLEKKVEEKVAKFIPKPVKSVGIYDVDGSVVLRSPRDIDTDGEGNFFVVDGGGFAHYVSKDLKFIRYIGKRPPDFLENWGYADGVCYDRKDKEVYLFYSSIDTIRVYNLEGALQRTYSLAKPAPEKSPRLDWGPMSYDGAMGIDGILWVVDANYFQLVGLNRKGEEVKRIGLPREHPDRKKPGDKSLTGPGYMAVSPKTGELFVMEGFMQRISVFDKDGKFVRYVGGRGGGPGGFLIPSGLSVDEKGFLYAGDRNLERIQIWDEKGEYVATLINPKEPDPEKQPIIAVTVNGIAASGNKVYVTNIAQERVRIYEILQ